MGKRGLMKPESFERRLANGDGLTRLTQKRLSRGLTQAELARITGMKQAYIAGLENRSRDINRAMTVNVYRIACALGCGIDDILEIDRLRDGAKKSATV